MGCYKCDRVGHVSRDCPHGTIHLCFHYNQVGHKKVDYLELLGGVVRELTPTTLRITDVRESRVGAPMVKI